MDGGICRDTGNQAFCYYSKNSAFPGQSYRGELKGKIDLTGQATIAWSDGIKPDNNEKVKAHAKLTLVGEPTCDHPEDQQTTETTKEPTCTEKGSKDTKCGKCGKVLKTDEIDALGHDPEETIVTVATCTEDGTTQKTCKREIGGKVCGADLGTVNEPKALGHYGENDVIWQYKDNNGVTNGEKYKECGRNNNGTICRERLATQYRNVIFVQYQNENGTYGEATVGTEKYVEAGVASETLTWSLPEEKQAQYIYITATMDTTSNQAQQKTVQVKLKPILTVVPNGGTWEGRTENQTFALSPGETRTINDATNKTGYTFSGWSPAGKVTNKEFTMGESSETITAQWTAIEYKVRYHGNGSTSGKWTTVLIHMIKQKT